MWHIFVQFKGRDDWDDWGETGVDCWQNDIRQVIDELGNDIKTIKIELA